MTHHVNECNESRDREWTASPTIERMQSPWKSSLGKTSQEFLAESHGATTRADKQHFMDMARRAVKEEGVHQTKVMMMEKTRRYEDRSRFRCIGTPLLTRDERQSMSLRSSGRLSPTQLHSSLQIPTVDTFHQFEAPGRQETILQRHKVERPAWLAGQRRDWDEVQHRIETGQQSARRVDVEGYGSQVRLRFSKESPSVDQKNIAGVGQPTTPHMDTSRLYQHRRPVSSFGKIYQEGQTLLVAHTANPPVGKRIFLHTHYTGWDGQAVGSRAPSPYEVRLEMRSGPPETATIRPFTVADGGSRSQRETKQAAHPH